MGSIEEEVSEFNTKLNEERERAEHLEQQVQDESLKNLLKVKAQLEAEKVRTSFLSKAIFNSEISYECEHCSDYQSEITKLKKEKDKLAKELEESHREKEEVGEEYEEEFNSLKAQLEDYQMNNISLKKEVQCLYDRLEDSMSKGQKASGDSEFSDSEEVQKLRKNLLQKDKLISKLEKEVEELAEEYETERSQEVKDLRMKNSILQNALKAFESKVNALEKQLEAKDDDYKQKTKKLEDNIEKLEHEKNSLQGTLRSLEKQVEVSEESNTFSQEQASKARAELLQEMTSRIHQLKQEKLDLEKRLEENTEDLQAFPRINNLQDELSELGEELFVSNASEENVQKLKEEKRELQKELNELRGRYAGESKLQAQLREAEKMIIEAKLKYAEAATERDKAKQKKKNKTSRFSLKLSKLFRKNKD